MSFAFYRSLTIDHTKCGGSDSSSFPVLVFGSDASLKDAAHGGHVQSSTGADILFFADSMGVVQYASEIEFYDNVNGILWAWVQVNVSHSTNTTFYVLYGNASPPARTTNPWDSNFAGVWHCSDNAANTTVKDSTANANNGSAISNTSGLSVSGQIGNALNNSGNTYPFVTVGTGNQTNFPTTGSACTVTLWVNFNAGGTTSITDFIEWGNSGGGTGQFLQIEKDSSAGSVCGGGSSAMVRVKGRAAICSGIAISAGAWMHLSVSFDGASTTTFYVNGVAKGTTGALSIPSTSFLIGAQTAIVDETHLSASLRGPDWILTEYNNQNAPGNIGSPGFLTWGSEQLSLLVEDKITPGSITSRIETGDIHFGGM